MNTIEKEAIEQNRLNKLRHHLIWTTDKDIIGFL